MGDKWEPRPYIVVKKQPSIPVYVVRSENTERVVHRNLLTQCMFLPVEQAGGMTRGDVDPDTEENMEMEDAENTGEQAGEVTIQRDESDMVEDLKMDNMEDNVEKCLTETTDEQIEHTGMEEVDVETGQVSEEVEEHVTARGANLPPTPSAPRRSSQRNRRPPKKLSYELRAVESEDDRQRVERGWKLWQRAKARRAAGHT